MKSPRHFIFVMGSTASGKSDWALRLALKFNGVILNCDSVQTYQKVEVGAAKPTAAERALVPHYLLDYVAPPQEMTAGQFLRDFNRCLEDLKTVSPIFVVGGTGFYFRAIEKGMYPVIVVPEEVKAQVLLEMQKDQGPEHLWQELRNLDPEYAAKLHSADHYRLGRAIELIRTQGRSVTAIQAEFAQLESQFTEPLLKIAPLWDREILKQRIQQRTKAMIEKGLVAETENLLAEGLEHWSPLSSVGYRETVAALKSGHLELENLKEEISLSTRQLAKKQKTWFQREKDLHWIPGGTGYDQAQERVEKFLNS